MSNIHARDTFRRHSLTAEVAVGLSGGFVADSYLLGLRTARAHLTLHPARRRTARGVRRRRSKSQ